jgi:hypothetical protein
MSLPPLQRDLLAHTAKEIIYELPVRPHTPYMDDEETGGR